MKSLLSAAGAIALLTAAGCSGKADAPAGDMSFESYSYEVVARYHDIPVELPDSSGAFCRLQGYGVLPLRIGDADLTPLRDSLLHLAAIDYTGARQLLPSPDSEREITNLNPDSVTACSSVISRLTLSRVTPDIIVWRNYIYEYPCRAAHGTYANTYVNYDVTGARVITLPSLFRDGYAAPLTGLLHEELAQRPDLLEPLDSIAIPANFELTADGIRFIYGLYEIAPYSSGEVSVDISGYELDSLLSADGRRLILGEM